MQLLDGKALAQSLLPHLKAQVAMLPHQPTLAIITNAHDPAARLYLRSKQRMAAQIGVKIINVPLATTLSQAAALTQLKKLNNDDTINGIMIQLPLDEHFDQNELINALDPRKDVDGCHPINLGKIWMNQPHWVPATALGVMHLLTHYHIPLAGQHAVVVGRSNIVGRPLAGLLLNANATVSIVHRRTANLAALTRQADILCVAAGLPHLITADMVKKQATVIVIGMNYNERQQLVGDVVFNDVSRQAAYLTPVPGGVGPMTVVSLMQQVIQAAKEKNCVTNR